MGPGRCFIFKLQGVVTVDQINIIIIIISS